MGFPLVTGARAGQWLVIEVCLSLGKTVPLADFCLPKSD
ncbi:hypothetical protein SAMN05216287_2196 [Pseudomonas kuykendallii]|uniref:Uncharacterized protein n=1 Tax=Pseudomonas kuykendallii TaxID=1007099 RepID=A0A1H2Z7P9_9PSED|nr:hypothetical protein SAMN05216287_2196 [Pseudomonas kuykendallii]